MSGFFGKTNAVNPIRYNGIQIGQSNVGACVPLQYGTGRLPFNLMWYGDFSSKAQQSGGGKGGGPPPSGYIYKASFAAGICEGPITALKNVYLDKDLTTLAKVGLSLFTGTSGQAPWGYLTTNFPSQAIPYDHVCYVVAQKYTLGGSASMPNFTFEIAGFLPQAGTPCTFNGSLIGGQTSGVLTSPTLANGTWNITFSDNEVRTCTVNGVNVAWSQGLINQVNPGALAGCVYDASPAAIIFDYLTDPNHGAGFPAANIAPLTGANSYESYCLSLGIGLSPAETTQRAAADFVTEILKITNSDAVWSAGTLKIIPYADAAVAGNGYSYTPNLTPDYIFTDDDYLEPIALTRKPTADTYNHVRIEYLERSNEYNTAIAEATDLGNIALTGERVMQTESFHEISNSATARIVGQLVLQTSLYERNTIKFKVRSDYCLLEPMDYIGIVDTQLGYGSLNNVGQYTSGQVFRVTSVVDDDKDTIEIEAMEVPGTVRTSAIYNWANVQGYNANFGVVPLNVQAPAFLEAYETLVGPAGGRELWIAVAGTNADTSWGGCNVYISFDNVTYELLAVQTSACRYGTIGTALAVQSDPDTVSTLNVLLSNTADTMTSGTQADADQDRTLCAVGSGATTEIISYETAALVAAGQYNLTYLRRGQYGTSILAHAIGAPFIRLDGSVLKIEVDPGYIGVPLYFKFCSFNIYGRGVQDISTVTAYSYTMGQALSAYKVVSSSTFLVGPGSACAVYSPTTAFKLTSGPANWTDSVYSAQSYTNGCTGEFSPSQTNGAIMMGLTNTPLSGNSYTNLGYSWYCTTTGVLHIYENGGTVDVNPAGYGAYTTSDLLSITYDGKTVVYYHNGAIVRSVPVVNNSPLFLQFCFFTAGASIYAMSYTNISPTSDQTTWLTYNGGASNVGSTITMLSGTAWTTGAYSTQSYANGCAFSCTQKSAVASSDDIFGLTTNPTASASYTNIPFSICMANGSWYVYENGAPVAGVAGTYAYGTVFEVIYDGKHVMYYVGGILVKSTVYTSTGAFYPQVSFGNIGDVVGDLTWGPLNQATTPFTIIPLTVYTAANGNTVTANSLLGTATFGERNWKSLESYSTGATCAGIMSSGGALYFGLTNNPIIKGSGGNPLVADGTFAFYAHSDVALVHIMVLGSIAVNLTFGATTDVYTIEYDTFWFYWYRNGTLVYQYYYPNVGPLYLYGDGYAQGNQWKQLSFGPNGALTPNPFLATGYCVTHDSSASKIGGTDFFDSAVYSINGYKTCHVQFKFAYGTYVMFGLTTTVPPSSPYGSFYTSISFAWYIAYGALFIYESGSPISGVTLPAPSTSSTDLFAITYDGSNVRYYINGTLYRTYNIVGATLYASSSFYLPGSTVNSLSFGPGTTLDTVPTASIDANAVTNVLVATVAGPVDITYTVTVTPIVVTNITVGPFSQTTTIVITATGTLSITNTSGSTQYGPCTVAISKVASIPTSSQGVETSYSRSDGFPSTTYAESIGFSLEFTDTLAPNATQNYMLIGGYGYKPGIPLDTANISNATIKAEAIKK